jgi:hypothetical protein
MTADAEKSSPFRASTLIVGALLCLLIAVGAPYSNVYLQGSLLAVDFGTAAALFLLFLVVWINTGVTALVGRRFSFSSQQLTVLYAMMAVACAIPTMGLMEYLLPSTTALEYYASPENDWREAILPYVQPWLVVSDPLAVKYFYEGLPSGAPLPWGAWARPLAAWSVFLGALYAVMISIAVIIRRRWMDEERLVYPLVQVPMALVSQDGRIVPPLLRSGMLWVGFGLAVAVGSMKGLHHYNNIIPDVVMNTSISMFRNTVQVPIMLSFAAVGLTWFVNLEIALGLWLFALLALVEKGTFAIIGVGSTEMISVYGTPESPFLAHQGIGALLIFVIAGLWGARQHLREVVRKAWSGRGIDDSGEMMSYRAASVTLIVGTLVMVAWLWLSGVPLLLAILLLAVAMAIFLALTRIVVEGGVAAARSPMIASTFIVSGVGAPLVGTAGLVALAFTYVWHGDVRTFVMASCANGLKVIAGVRRTRAMLWAIVLAIAVAAVGSTVTILHLAYTHGGINLHTWFFGAGARTPFEFVATKLSNQPGVQWEGWMFKGIGAGTMALLMYLRHHFLWWPLHPLGFTICTVSFIVARIWFSFFIAWLLKLVVLKYGGPSLYRQVTPLFMGLVLGQFCNAGFWILIDTATGTVGNGIGALFW